MVILGVVIAMLRRVVAPATPAVSAVPETLAQQVRTNAMVAFGEWALLALMVSTCLAGVLPAWNDHDTGPSRRASCRVESCTRRQCVLSCALESGERLEHTSCPRQRDLPGPGTSFRATLRRGSLDAWIIDEASIRIASRGGRVGPR